MRTPEELDRARRHIRQAISGAPHRELARPMMAMLEILDWAAGVNNRFVQLLDEMDEVDAQEKARNN